MLRKYGNRGFYKHYPIKRLSIAEIRKLNFSFLHKYANYVLVNLNRRIFAIKTDCTRDCNSK